MDAEEVCMVIDNDATSKSSVEAIAKEVITEAGWAPGQDVDTEPYAHIVAASIGSDVWDYIRSWFPSIVTAGDHLGSLILKQLGSSIDWSEVGRYYMDDYAEHLND